MKEGGHQGRLFCGETANWAWEGTEFSSSAKRFFLDNHHI
jgi:hypothetical protein